MPAPPDAAAPTASAQGAPSAAAPAQEDAQTRTDAAAQASVPPADAAANAAAMAASPATPATDAAEAATTTQASTATVCQPRVTSVHFGARGSALNQENRNALEYAVDAASVCTLESVVISDSAEGRISTRRAEAVRATLVRQGVPRDRITVASAANAEGASTGQLDVRMNFAGVALAGAPAATNEAEPTPTPTPPAS
jgi:outer membrane protein OmpA-like peptidoglycan-associated protein